MSHDLQAQSRRSVSIDAYRGLVMLAMASGGAAILGGLPRSSGSFTGPIVAFLSGQLDHVAWRGCSFWDLIQPSFMFLVGVAMPFSYANRRARGQSWPELFRHALGRSLILIALGIFLSSAGGKTTQTNFTFVNVLTQIGLGYMVVFLLLGR